MSHGFNFNLGGLNLGAAGKAEETKTASGTKGLATQEHGKDEVSHELRDGDYQVIVHVIEARKLKPVDTENGTADPVVVASLTFPSSVVAKRQNSPRKVNTLNPVWDYTMIFRENRVAAHEGKMALLSLQVKDANWAERDVVIGQFDFNLSSVYGRRNHEYFQQWCALMDPTGDSGEAQGYLKVNVTVLVGTDEMAVHSEEQVQKEKFSLEYGVTSFRDVLSPPHVIQGRSAVCLELIRGEGIQPLDMSSMIGLGGVDPFVKLQFGNQAPVTSSYINGAREPVWEQQLEVPVLWPTMIDVITVSVWDHDTIGTDDAVGAMRFSLSSLPQALPGTSGPPIITDFFPNWRNLYGAPPEADYASGAKSALTAFAMNHGGREGTYFRGRLLMRIWKRLDPFARLCSYDLPIDSTLTMAFKETVSGTKSDDSRQFVAQYKETMRFDPAHLGEQLYKAITESKWTLRLALYEASDMALANTGMFGRDVFVECRVGADTKMSKGHAVDEGRAMFNELLPDIDLVYPEIYKSEEKPQFPDIFLYLVRGNSHIAYVRWTAHELLAHTKTSRNSEPAWCAFIEEPCLDAFGPGEIPGSLLCNIQLGKEGTLDSRGGMLLETKTSEYQMRFHLFMAKFLPAKDENGLCDPYVVVKCCGKTLYSSVKGETCNPSWYETLVCDVSVPDNAGLAPPVSVLLYDKDMIGDEFIGRFFVTIDQGMFCEPSTVPDPRWYKLAYETEGDISGELLASVSMIPIAKKSSDVPSLIPETYDATIEITAIGLRDMTPVPMFGTLGNKLGLGNLGLPLVAPYVEFDVGDADTRLETASTSSPSPANANFLEKYTIQMQLPKDPKFAPNITLRVRDVRSLPANLGGFVLGKPLVASGVVALDPLMPWSKSFKPNKNPLVQKSMELMQKTHATDAEKKAATRKGMADIGKGAFDAMKKMRDNIADFLDDGEIDEPKYLLGRKKIDNEFENTLSFSCPIMSFPLFRGCEGFFSQEMTCGTFKGYISVTRKDDDIMPELDFENLFQVKQMCVRLYLLKAYGIPPMDMNGSADSYPVIQLGDTTITDKDSKVDMNLNPNYYSSYDMSCQIPGASNLTVSLWDEDTLNANDLIGSTTVDIENRLYNPEWAAYTLKPLERRTLRLPTSPMSQGKVEMWVDILTPAEAKELPMPDIKPPKPEEFELRVVVWETRNVPIKTATTSGEQKLDMIVACNFIGYESIQATSGIGAHMNRWDYAMTFGELADQMERRVKRAGKLVEDKLIEAKNNLKAEANPGFEKQTDVHWYCRDGRGRFNHRMVWPMVYNLDGIYDKNMRLQVSVRDYDVSGKDNMIGQVQLDLQPMLKSAFRHRERNDYLHVTTPFRLAEGALKDWKMTFDLEKDGYKQGQVVLQIEVASKLVGLLRPAGEGRSEPNNHPKLPEPLRRMPWDEAQTYSPQGGLCGCCGGGGNGNMAATTVDAAPPPSKPVATSPPV